MGLGVSSWAALCDDARVAGDLDMGAAVRPREMTLLVVEDDRISRDLLVRALRREGYAVLEAVDGEEALEILAGASPDLILLDITMPRVSGLEVLHAVRQRFGLLDLPVVMTSARTEVEDVIGALQLGANDYVMKPLNFPITLRRVASVLAHRRAALERERLARRLELVVDHAGLAVSLHGPDGAFRGVSRAVERLLGRAADDLRGLRLHDLLHPEDAAGLARRPADLPDVYVLVARLLRADGFAWCELTSQALRDGATGQVVQVQALWRDLSGSVRTPDTGDLAGSTPDRGASFAFTPAPAPERLRAGQLRYGPPISADATPLPSPTAEAPPVVVPGVPDEVRDAILAQLRPSPRE